MASRMGLAQNGLMNIVESHDHLGRGEPIEDADIVSATGRSSIDDVVLDEEVIGAAESRRERPFEITRNIPRAFSPVVEIESIEAREIQDAMVQNATNTSPKGDHLVIRV